MKEISVTLSPLKMAKHYLRQMAPLFWGVSIMPFYMGWSLASKKMYPTYLYPPSEFQGSLQVLHSEVLVFILGILIVGPFLGGATILFNDYFDRKIDVHSRRKIYLPLLRGILKPKSIFKLSIAFFLLSLILSFFISLWFIILIFICILLSIIYSSPPFRFKERPGLDFITNALGSGVICSLAGWAVVKPISEFPFLWAVLSFFGVGVIYIPTTIIDYEPDLKEGVKTIATYLGKKKTYYIGMGCLIIANSIIVLMGLLNYIISPEFLYFAWPIIIAEIVSYWYLLRRLDFKGGYYSILTFSLLVAFGNGLILFYNAGLLAIP